MKIGRRQRLPLVLALALLAQRQCVWASEDEDEDNESGEDEDDAFFNFYDDTMWSDYSIQPERCINYNNQDVVVFEMYGANNNQCTKQSQGKYTATVYDFVYAHSKQDEEDAELMGYDYDEPEYLDYLECTAYAVNDDTYVYFKIGCLSTTGLNLDMKVYSDSSCTKEILDSSYSLDIDLSYLKKHVSFGKCQACVTWPEDGDDVDEDFYTEHAYESPLCSGAWYYKSDCDRKCKKLAKSYGQSKKTGFTRAGKFWLFVFSLLGFFLLFEVIKQRKKMSTQDSLLEEAAIQKAGLQKRQVALIVLAVIVLIVLFMLLKLRVITWMCLLGVNVLLLGYLFYLRYRARGKVEVGGFRLFGDKGEQQQSSSDFAPPPRQVEMS